MPMPILKIFFIILASAGTCVSLGQSFIIKESDTAYVNSLFRKGQRIHYSNSDSAIYYYQMVFDNAGIQAMQITEKLSYLEKSYIETTIQALNKTGNIFYYKDEYSRSGYYYHRSLELASSSGLKDYAALALFDLGYVSYKNNDYASAEGYFAEAYQIFSRTGNLHGMFEAINASGLNYRRLGDFDRSDSCYKECFRIASTFNDSLMIADVMINQGILLCEQGQLEEGILLFEDALSQYENANNKQMISLSLLNIGVVMKMVEEYDKALSYINRSAEIEEILQQKSQLVVRYYNLADLYLEMGEPDKAYEYCRKIETVAGEIGSQPFISECKFLLGKYYFLKDDLARAGDHFLEAAGKAVSDMHKPLLANINLWRAKVELKKGEIDSAIYQAHHAYTISGEMHLLLLQKDASRILSEAYEKAGDFKLSLRWYKTFLNHSDSLSYFNQLREISKTEARYNYEKKERENELLRNKTALQEQKLKNRSVTTIALLSGVVLSIVIILLLIRRNRDARLLYEQQQLLNLQHLEEIESELDGKKRELTSKMLFLNQKSEMISRLIRRLQELQQEPGNSNEELTSIVNELRTDTPQSNWKEFEAQFTQVHPDFYKRLYEKHPDLSSYEQRICAFLRMNLNTKEISAITGRSAKSIEVTRSRIRTKLKLSRNDNLSSFLASV